MKSVSIRICCNRPCRGGSVIVCVEGGGGREDGREGEAARPAEASGIGA